MTTAQALQIVSAEEAALKLRAAGYTEVSCESCKGAGHHTVAPRDGADWRRYVCATCDGVGKVWNAPATR